MRFQTWISTLVFLLCVSGSALGQQKVARKQADIHADAEEKFRRGRDAQSRGDCKLALEFFRASHGLEPGRGKLLNIALCEKQLGQLATAMQHFQETLPQLASDDDRRQIVKENIAELKPRMPYLRIVLGANAPAGTAVTYDNAELEPTMIGTDMSVDPGKHMVIVEAEGRPDRRYEVMIEEGKRRTVRVEPGVIETAPSVEARKPSQATKGRRTAGFVVGGIGVASLVVGGVTGGLALGDHAAAERGCPEHEGCSSVVLGLASRGKALSIASTVGLAAGVVGTGVGTYLVLSSRTPEKDAPAVGITLFPDGARIGIRGAF